MDAAPPPAPPQPASPTWPRSAQFAAAVLLGAALALLGVHAWGHAGWGSRPTELNPRRAVDLNRADRAELVQLPGVGDGLAARIEEYRRERGRFRSVEELRKVHGIGAATMARLRPLVYVEGGKDESDAETVPTAAAPAPKAAGLSGVIDVNTASAADLRKLPGIGPKLSQAIIDERERAPFASVDDLRRVHGIGAKTLDRLRPYITAGRESVNVASGD